MPISSPRRFYIFLCLLALPLLLGFQNCSKVQFFGWAPTATVGSSGGGGNGDSYGGMTGTFYRIQQGFSCTQNSVPAGLKASITIVATAMGSHTATFKDECTREVLSIPLSSIKILARDEFISYGGEIFQNLGPSDALPPSDKLLPVWAVCRTQPLLQDGLTREVVLIFWGTQAQPLNSNRYLYHYNSDLTVRTLDPGKTLVGSNVSVYPGGDTVMYQDTLNYWWLNLVGSPTGGPLNPLGTFQDYNLGFYPNIPTTCDFQN